MRLAVVLSHPTQYYSPWFRWLRTRTPLELRVFYLWDFGVHAARDPGFGQTFAWDADLLSGYESEFVPNAARDPGTHHFSGLRNPTLVARLTAWRPEAILLFGYAHPSHLRAIHWARHRGVPLIFRGDSHLLGRTAPRLLKRFLLSRLFRRFAAITHVGAANCDYFRVYGVPEARQFFTPHAVDDSLYDPTRSDHQAAARRLRGELGLLAAARVILFAGKLEPKKQPRLLLETFLALHPENTVLLFVGDGVEKNALAARAANAPAVRFLPFANQSEMPARYLLADLFVLPSRGAYETWGLAVNEAMHLGVPCLVSDEVGCQRDLVTDGETGWVFRAGDAAQLAAKLTIALAALRERGPRIKQAVATRIAGYTYAQTTAGLLAALASLPVASA